MAELAAVETLGQHWTEDSCQGRRRVVHNVGEVLMSQNIVLASVDNERALRTLIDTLGAEKVIVDPAALTLMSQDLSFQPGATALAAVRPETIEELSRAVEVAASAGVAVVPRGGGMSYTRGYVHQNELSVIIDMSGLDRIVHIDADSMYVVVETGCTWKALYEALDPLGLRTPYFGPLSGMYATVGGALSQNSLFHGSGAHGTAAESVLGLRVVLADGSVLTTGSGAASNGKPFFRHFGPDVTGLFTSDTGAFGIKAEAVLRLIRKPAATEYLSFAFDDLNAMLLAQTAICRLGLASECYGFDPFYNRAMEANGIDFHEGLAKLGEIVRRGGLSGIARAARVALSGKRMLRNVRYSLHVTIDGDTPIVAAEHARLVREAALAAGGSVIANSVPVVFRNAPFGGIRSLLLGPDGEVWLPVHGYFPVGDALSVAAATEEFLADNAALMEANDIRTSYLTCFARNAFFIEPIFFWRDALGEFRLSLLEEDQVALWHDRAAAPDQRAVVLDLRRRLLAVYEHLGGIQMQTGKYYDYAGRIESIPLLRVMNGIKRVLDPLDRMNPGALGLVASSAEHDPLPSVSSQERLYG